MSDNRLLKRLSNFDYAMGFLAEVHKESDQRGAWQLAIKDVAEAQGKTETEITQLFHEWEKEVF